MNYYSVERSRSNDELIHWKYIKRYKKNGKWVYVYEGDQPDAYDKNLTTTTTDKNTGMKTETTYRNSDRLLSSTTSANFKSSGKTVVTKERGLIQQKANQAVRKGEKAAYNILYKNRGNLSNRRLSDVKQKIDSGIKWIVRRK